MKDDIKDLINKKDMWEIVGRHPSLISIFYTSDEIIEYVEKCNVWNVVKKIDDTKRGQLLEHYCAVKEFSNLTHLGRLDKGKFEHWDFWDDVNKVMISQKSVKLPPATKKPASQKQWIYELQKEIRDLAAQTKVDFKDKLPNGKVVTVFKKQLDVVIPTGMETKFWNELKALENYGNNGNNKKYNVKVFVKELL